MTINNLYVSTKRIMNGLGKFVAKLMFPRAFKFNNDFKNAFLEAVKQTSQFDDSVRDLAQTWLAVCPYTYFSELFLKTEKWNAPFVQALDRSDMVDAKICFQLTQAFYLRNLFRVLINDENYKKYSKARIIQNIVSQMSFGSRILSYSNNLEQAINNMASIEDFTMCYVEKIFETQYNEKNSFASILASIWVESNSLFGLSVFTAESMKRAKYIDNQSTLDT